MKLLWALLVIFAGLIIFFGLRKPAPTEHAPIEPIQESTIIEPQRDPRIIEHKPSTHGNNNRVIENPKK